ncbi:MAG: DUF2849 domain-containing protein [Candidatus Binatia bacterium]|nr:DUF2849 domain-containing protein [Candidatus Binatia bacterium]
MPNVPRCYVITGSLTDEGSVAYLRAGGTWATTLAEAHAFKSEQQAETKLAEVKVHESVITEPYIFAAERVGDAIKPVSAREILRAEGPSTRIRRPDQAGARAS